ncbi:hypothetical protein [Nitrospirillum iridis]|uniref:Uncharacterized protein n=1 Tax=Nitrospirillum iridis TaxID=765888 RepID=A0A7X0AYR3_9PROT|nr:hypothetical protein [Nitrospirillum iridis]MBB6251801.1 hypothetical protein [Nitrospirillum iridis]
MGTRPAGPTARAVYRLRATMGRRAALAWTLATLWLAAFWMRIGPAVGGHGRAAWHQATLAMTLTAPQAVAGTLRHLRDRALDHAARRMRTMPPSGARRRLHHLWAATAVRLGYALDHQASRLTWRLARALRALEREHTTAPGRPRPLPPRPAPRAGWMRWLGGAAWAMLEWLAHALDQIGVLIGRGLTATLRTGRSGARHLLRHGRALGRQGAMILRRGHTRGTALAHAALRRVRHGPTSWRPPRWMAAQALVPRAARLRLAGGLIDGRGTLRRAGGAALSRLRRYPWRRLGARLLVPAQCAACIIFGVSLMRRGDMVHMLAGGLLVTAFVLMAVVYAWMQMHPPKAGTEGDPAPNPAAAQVPTSPSLEPALMATAMPSSAPEAPVPATGVPAAGVPTGGVPAVDVPVDTIAAPVAAAGPGQPRRKRSRRKATADASPPTLTSELRPGV